LAASCGEGGDGTADEVTTASVESTASGNTSVESSDSRSDPDQGFAVDSVRVQQTESVTTLDPAQSANIANHQTIVLTGGQLFRLSQSRVAEPELAESIERSSDGLTATVRLREDLKYSDGTPVVAADAVRAFERLKELKSAAGGSLLGAVDDVSAPDETTIVFSLNRRDPYLESSLGQYALILHPAERVADADAAEEYFTNPVSAGPYMVKDWIPGTPRVLLEANPSYFRGTPAIGNIELVSIADPTSTVSQLQSGSIDFAFGIPSAAIDSFSADVRVFPHAIGGTYHIASLLASDGPLGDPTVQQAMSLALDRDEIVEKAFLGTVEPSVAFTYSSAPDFPGPTLPNGGKQDLDEARRLLATTQWPDGFKFELQYWSVRDGLEQGALLISEQLGKIGIDVELRPMDIAESLETLTEGDFDAVFIGNQGVPAAQQMRNWTCDASWGSFTRYSLEFDGLTYGGVDPELCSLSNAALSASSVEEGAELLRDLEARAVATLPVIPLADRATMAASRIPEGLFEVVENDVLIWVATMEEL